MKRAAAICLLAPVVVVALAACSGNGEPLEVSGPPASEPDADPVAAGAAEQLLVGSGEGLATLAVLDPDSGALEPIGAPPEIGDPAPLRAVVGAHRDHVLVQTADAAYLWNREDETSTLVGHGGEVLGLAPPHSPVVVLLDTNRARQLVDLQRGTIHDVPPQSSSGLVPRLDVDAVGDVAVVNHPRGGATAFDLTDGTIEHHDSELLFFDDGLSADGTTAVGGRRSEHGFEVVAVPLFDPASSAVWYTPARREAQVTTAWIGNELLAVDLSGRVITITDGAVTELGRVGQVDGDDPSVMAVEIHPDPLDPSTRAALVEARGSGPNRWYRVDLVAATIDELPAVEDHHVVGSALSGHLLVGVGTVPDGISSLRLVRLADGSVVELFDDPGAPQLSVRSVSDAVVGLTRFEGRPVETELFDLSGRARGVVTGRLGFTANGDVTRAAVFHLGDPPGWEGSVTTIVSLDGSAPEVAFAEVMPLAWLPAG